VDEEIRRLINLMYRRLWELRKELEDVYEYSFSRITSPYTRGPIEPLHSIYEFPDEYVIIVDIPVADSSSITVQVSGEYLEIKARMIVREAIESMLHAEYRREEALYVKRILLPPDADAFSMRYRVSGGRLIINIPKKAGL